MANQTPIEKEAVTLNDVIALIVIGHLCVGNTNAARRNPEEVVASAYGVADAFMAEKERRAKT
jgi:hypothetical protein